MNADDMPIVNQDNLNQEDCNKQTNKKGDSYSQNGNYGIGHMSGGVIKGNAKVVGKEETNKSQCQAINAKQVTVNNSNSSNNSNKTTIKITQITTEKIGDKETSETVSIEVPVALFTVDLKEFLENIAGNSIKIKDIDRGSIRFILKGSEQGLKTIVKSFESGKLAPLLRERFNLELENAQLIDPDSYQKDRSQKLLAFTIAGDVSQADIDILKAELISTSDDDEEIKNEEKSRLVEEIRTQGVFKRNLRGADLSEANLSDADLSNANLSEANLRSSNLRSANLRSTNLRDANLLCANLSGASLRDADLKDANLSAADLRDADLSFANLRDADLSAADLRDANLSSTDLSGFDLSGFDLSRVNLNGASLIEASLIEASLIEASLIGTNLNGIKLNGADLSYANLSEADISFADLRDANVKNARFSNNSLGISEPLKQDLIARGAIFKDFSGDRSEDLTPV